MLRHTLLSLATLSPILFLAAPVSSQDVQLSIAAGWYSPGGDDFKDTDPGPGFDAVALFSVAPRFRVGGGVQWNVHDVDFSTDNYNVISLFAEPRVELGGEAARLQPFLAGRLAWVRKTIDVTAGSRTANGIGVGAMAGLGYQVSSTLALEAAVTAYYLSFGDFKLEGQTLANSDSSGNALGLRVALVLSP